MLHDTINLTQKEMGRGRKKASLTADGALFSLTHRKHTACQPHQRALQQVNRPLEGSEECCKLL